MCTKPQTLKLLIVGVRADVREDVRVDAMASVTLAPLAKSKSMLDLDSVRAVTRLDVNRASAVTEFPKTSPHNGIIRFASNDVATEAEGELTATDDENNVGKLAASNEVPQPTSRLSKACRFNFGYFCLHLDVASRAAMTPNAAT